MAGGIAKRGEVDRSNWKVEILRWIEQYGKRERLLEPLTETAKMPIVANWNDAVVASQICDEWVCK
jgi:hypothetical protein